MSTDSSSTASKTRPSLLSLPLDIHALLLVYLSPSDVQKLCTLSHASYDLFTSPAICSNYLSLHGIFTASHETAKIEFDNYFIPQARIRKQKPTRATVVDGLRMGNSDAPYFTTSHAYQSCDGSANRDGVVVYRTNAGDLALIDLSDSSRSSVLLLTEDWEFTTQPLGQYNKSGAGVAVIGGIKERISTGWWTAESFREKGIGLKKFDVNIHNDFGGEVLLVEFAWAQDDKATAPYDVMALLAAAHTPMPVTAETTWYPVIARTKSLGMVISLKPETFGHPIAVFSLPPTKFPYAEYVLNSYYITGIVPTTQQFVFLRYARDGIDSTVCSMVASKKDDRRSQLFWKIPEYLPTVVTIDLAKLGLTGFKAEYRMLLANNLDAHVQTDKVGELVFIITGAGATAFDISRASQYGGFSPIKSFWWRSENEMKIYIPGDEDLDKEEIKRVGSWREGIWTRAETRSGCGQRLIAPSIPRIWKSFLPGMLYGGGEGDEEMFTIVRGYNYVVQAEEDEVPLGHSYKAVPAWQRPEFLVAWEIPLTRKGLERYSSKLLNRRAGFSHPIEDLPSPGLECKGSPYFENKDGIYPNKIMRLQTALTTNLSGVLRCFESHWVLATEMPQMFFARRDTHKTRPRWLTINDNEITVEGDEYRAIVGPVGKGRWKIENQDTGVPRLQRRKERSLLKLNRDTRLKCDRPYPRTVRFGKRRSGFVSMFWGKGETLPALTEKLVMESELEPLPKGSIHHIKVGDSGNYLAYVLNASPVPTPDLNRFGGSGGGPSGTLVIVRYN
ncbi:hypothetical protein TWF730_000096 [Orbilia blumenaviensis]|uniref:F-box domain-containing protein n=1 Tax=Orbilia blumenaviensis TaxID=1796055 RepID=A0AAV9VKI4_9PEZI